MTPSTILANLEAPGQTLAFCDETDVTREATSTMVAGIHMQAALVMRSERYGPAAKQLLDACLALGAPEVHAAEIVNPGRSSPWHSVSVGDRFKVLQLACELVCANADVIWFVHISEEQYHTLRAEYPELPSDYKSGVKESFLGHLTDALLDAPAPVIVKDRETAAEAATLKLLPDAVHIAGGGAVCANSEAVVGIQLADVAAYIVSRYVKRRDVIIASGANPLDTLLMETLDRLSGRIKSLLGEPAQDA